MDNVIKKRNLFVGFLLTVITLGFYVLYWLVKTKHEINALGGKIPTAWLLIIPFANIYWLYKYSEFFGKIIKKDDHGLIYFLLYLVFFPAFPIIVQSTLNNFSSQAVTGTSTQNSIQQESQNELRVKDYILKYKSQYSRDQIKTALVNSGIPEAEVEGYLVKYL